MKSENKKGFQIKDLVVTALLAVCAIALYMLCAILSFSPYTMLLICPIWSIVGAITYFLTAVKTKSPWALFVFCAIVGLYGFYPPMIVCGVVAGAVSTLLAANTGCTNSKTLTISYMVFMVLIALGGAYIPFLFFSQQTIAEYTARLGAEYMGLLKTLVSPITVAIILAVVALCAFVGALIAKKMLRKHFRKAGMI